MPYARIAIVPVIILVFACSSSPTQPSHDPRDPATQLVGPVCAVAGAEIHCTVQLSTQGSGATDATNTATWSVADSNLSDGLTPSTVAVVATPGRIVPLRHGDIAIHVRMPAGHVVASNTYEVDPAAEAIPLVPYLSGEITELDSGAPVGGVHVEITGGIDGGKSDETRSNGFYFIEHLRMGLELSVRASKVGYIPVDQTHAPIVDDVNGFPGPSVLHFKLKRVSH